MKLMNSVINIYCSIALHLPLSVFLLSGHFSVLNCNLSPLWFYVW